MESKAEIDFITTHLRNISALELILLKGHLIFEHQVNTLIKTYYLANPSVFSSLRLSFEQKLKLIECLHRESDSLSTYVSHLKTLNQLRNKLAHQLDFNPHKDNLIQWAINVLAAESEDISDLPPYELVMHAIYSLYGQIKGYFRGYHMATKGLRLP